MTVIDYLLPINSIQSIYSAVQGEGESFSGWIDHGYIGGRLKNALMIWIYADSYQFVSHSFLLSTEIVKEALELVIIYSAAGNQEVPFTVIKLMSLSVTLFMSRSPSGKQLYLARTIRADE